MRGVLNRPWAVFCLWVLIGGVSPALAATQQITIGLSDSTLLAGEISNATITYTTTPASTNTTGLTLRVHYNNQALRPADEQTDGVPRV
jgi:hypothetical protein